MKRSDQPMRSNHPIEPGLGWNTFVVAVIVAASTVLGASLLTAPEAGAWSEGACPTTSGVTVVIDFHELGGGVHVRCSTGSLSSGFDALKQAGVEYQTTVRQPGFLCKIAGKPTNDPCVNPSPATAYWSYWLASRGGSWCFSNWGAGNRTPVPGTVEGWSFSLNKSSSTPPPPGAAPPPAAPGTRPSALASNDCDSRVSVPGATTTTVPSTGGPRSPATTTPKGSTPKPNGPVSPGSAGSGSAGPQAGNPGGAASGGTPSIGAGSRPGAASTIAGANSPAGGTGRDGSVNGQEKRSTDATGAGESDVEVLAESESGKASGNSSATHDSSGGELPGDGDGDHSGASKSGRAGSEAAAVKASDGLDLGGDGGRGSAAGVVVALVLVVAIASLALWRRRLGRSD